MAAKKQQTAVRAAQIAAGILVGLGLAELGFAARDGWAFPHLNIYRADAQYGVRLRPNATAKVRFGGAEATTVRTNASGFRGADWGAPAENEVLVVGDSQAFGLGVEEHESFAARLGSLLGPSTHVSNAAVPTFGPIEMERVLEEQIPARKPKLVIYVVNAYNDFFEASRPNTDRHQELDGWAVRKETAIGDERAFPGRSWLYGKSHLGVALHRFLRSAWQPSALGVPSEGTWKDLLGGAGELRRSQEQVTALRRESLRLSELEILQAENAYVRAQLQTESIAYDVLPSARLESSGGNTRVTIADVRATPGDITDYGWGGEDSRPGPISAQMIRLATEMRGRALAELSARADKGERRAEDIKAALARESTRRAALDEVKKRPLTLVRAMSPMSRRIARAKALADQAKAELVVVVVPLDVQVSPKQWAKYGQAAIDMEPSRALGTDVVETAEALGALGLDLTEALRAAGDDAFLPKDLHLTAKGHEAAARAIAERIKKGRRVEQRLPIGGLPKGRSRAPSFTEWNSVGETLVYGSSARRCVTKRIREWVGIWCTEGDGYTSVREAAHAVKLVQGGRGEQVIARWTAVLPPGGWNPRETTRTHLVLIAPVLPEDTLIADFYWPHGKKSRLTIRFPANLEEQTVEFDRKWVDETAAPLDLGPDAAALCECQKKLSGKKDCLGLPAQPSAECRATYGAECAPLVACASGDPRFPPVCPAGKVNAGAMERCTPLCGPSRTCAAGQRCVDWQGGEVCLPEDSIPAGATHAPPVTELMDADPQISPETMALARAVLDVGRRVTASCKLVNVEKDNLWFDVYDECALDAAVVVDLENAVAALEARLSATPAERGAGLALYARASRLFADWTAQARVSKSSRGTLPAFARAAEAWQAYQPGEKVVVYSDAVLGQYREGLRTKGKAASSPLPVWETCKTGPCL